MNSISYTPEGALKAICYLCEAAYSKGKRKININQIWSIADKGLRYEYDTSYNNNKNVSSTTTIDKRPIT